MTSPQIVTLTGATTGSASLGWPPFAQLRQYAGSATASEAHWSPTPSNPLNVASLLRFANLANPVGSGWNSIYQVSARIQSPGLWLARSLSAGSIPESIDASSYLTAMTSRLEALETAKPGLTATFNATDLRTWPITFDVNTYELDASMSGVSLTWLDLADLMVNRVLQQVPDSGGDGAGYQPGPGGSYPGYNYPDPDCNCSLFSKSSVALWWIAAAITAIAVILVVRRTQRSGV